MPCFGANVNEGHLTLLIVTSLYVNPEHVDLAGPCDECNICNIIDPLVALYYVLKSNVIVAFIEFYCLYEFASNWEMNET